MILLLALLACGTERWDVKVLQDPAAWEVHKNAAIWNGMGHLTHMKGPAWGNATPRAPAEMNTATLSAWIVGYKLKDDGDYHVVIQGEGVDDEATMVVEFPAPACVRHSRWETQLLRARAQLEELIPTAPTPKMRWLGIAIPVTVSGVVFFDKVHGQAGVAPNGVELHPVLWIVKREP